MDTHATETFLVLLKTPPKFGLLSIIYREVQLPFVSLSQLCRLQACIERYNPDSEGGSIAMNLFHTKMIEREAKRLADGMRANGLLVTKDDYKEILADLIGISQNEVQAGRSPLEWFDRGHSNMTASLSEF